MQISPVSFRAQSFQANKSQQPKPIVDIKDKKDDEVVMFSTWGGNYAYPITVGEIKAVRTEAALERLEQLRDQQPNLNNIDKTEMLVNEENKIQEHSSNCVCESQEEYCQRKLFTPEWFM